MQFVAGETVSTLGYQSYKVHAAKVGKTKDKSIFVSAFRTDIPPIMGGLVEVKEISTPLTAIRTPDLWNVQDGVSGIYPRASKLLHNQRIKLRAGFNR